MTAEAASRLKLRNRIVLYVMDYSRPIPASATQVARALRIAEPKAVVAISNLDSATFAARLPRRAPERYGMELRLDSPPYVEVSEAAAGPALRAAGVDLAQVRSSATAVARELPRLAVTVDLKETVTDSTSAPNTIGILEGSDPALRDEYLVFSAHMDHVGITPGAADSINNGRTTTRRARPE
jgi:hypothetical protein